MLINILFPIFGIIATGFLCGKIKLIGENSAQSLNAFVYWVALPALLFGAMAKVELEQVYNPQFILAFAGAAVATWGIMALVGRLFFRLPGPESAMHGLNGAYANTGYMGIPLSIAAFGQDAALPAIVAAVISVLSIALAIIPLEISRNKEATFTKALSRSLKALIKNPMIISPCAGLLVSALGFDLPKSIGTYLDLLGAAAGPCALFSIGLYLVGKPVNEGAGELASMTLGKLVLNPLLTALAIIYLFPTDPLWTKMAILLAALPIGSGPFVLAQSYGVYTRQTSAITLLTTLFSFVTLSILFAYKL